MLDLDSFNFCTISFILTVNFPQLDISGRGSESFCDEEDLACSTSSSPDVNSTSNCVASSAFPLEAALEKTVFEQSFVVDDNNHRKKKIVVKSKDERRSRTQIRDHEKQKKEEEDFLNSPVSVSPQARVDNLRVKTLPPVVKFFYTLCLLVSIEFVGRASKIHDFTRFNLVRCVKGDTHPYPSDPLLEESK